jgi:glutathione S-transferase
MAYTLYYTPNTCSLVPDIVLRESGQPFTLDKVDPRTKKTADGGDFLVVSPNGYVPALRLPTGDVLTETAVMVQYIADQAPEAGLVPPFGTLARYRMMEWLNFIATELHKGQAPLHNVLASPDHQDQVANRIGKRLEHVRATIGERDWLIGDHFTIADAYVFYTLHAWQKGAKRALPGDLSSYYQRLATRPAVVAALAAEGVRA